MYHQWTILLEEKVFCWIHKPQNLWHHIDIAAHYNLCFCFFKNLMYESEIRSDISGTYEKHFQFDYSWDDWKLIPGPFMILIKWQYLAILSNLLILFRWYFYFWSSHCTPLKRQKIWKCGFWLLWQVSKLTKRLELAPSPPNYAKRFPLHERMI